MILTFQNVNLTSLSLYMDLVEAHHHPRLLMSSLRAFLPLCAGMTYIIRAYLRTRGLNYTSYPKIAEIYSFPKGPK